MLTNYIWIESEARGSDDSTIKIILNLSSIKKIYQMYELSLVAIFL